MAQRLLDQLGPDLYSACIQNDVAQVENLTSSIRSPNWFAAIVTVASNQAADVAGFCLRGEGQISGIKDHTLWWVLADGSLVPAYRFLVEWKFLDVNHVVAKSGLCASMRRTFSCDSLNQFNQQDLLPKERQNKISFVISLFRVS